MLMYIGQVEGVSLIENENGDACLVILAIIFASREIIYVRC